MLQFIPFVPRDSNGVSEELWTIAHSSWLALLAALLDKPDKEFISEIEANTSLHSFMNDIISAQIDMTAIDLEISKFVFITFVRAVRLGASSPLLSRSTLCNFAMIYGPSNCDVVRTMFKQRNLDLKEPLDALIQCIKDMPHSITLDRASLERARVATRLLYILTLVWDEYNAQLLQDILFETYDTIIPVLQADDEALRPHIYQIKKALVSTLDNSVVTQFLRPLGFDTSRKNHTQLEQIDPQPITDTEELIQMLSNRLTDWFETSGLEEKRTAYVDAPLIMDWEVTFAVSDRLEMIDQKLFNGENDHIQYLQLSMNQIRDMNLGTPTWAQDTQRHQLIIESFAEPSLEKTLKISQVQDVFPELGDGFVDVCLEANENNVEVVIAQIIEGNLPPSVASLDRQLKKLTTGKTLPAPNKDVKSGPLKTNNGSENIRASRHNIYDGSKFGVSKNSSLGYVRENTSKKNLNDERLSESDKARILERMYNMYEDEYDDTYDEINEVSGRVELDAVEEDGEALDVVKRKKEQVDPGILHESDLVHNFMQNREVFGRTSAIRKSKQRAEMRKLTSMTDEQLEGWAIMFDRNPRKQRILDKYMLFDGAQNEVSDAQKNESQGPKNSKPSSQSSERDRAYKDKNKARFGNHSRKKMHNRKLASTSMNGG